MVTRAEKYSKVKIIPRSSGLKAMARGIGRRNYSTIARQVMLNPRTRVMCLKVLKKYLHLEMTQVASGYSCLRQKDLESLQKFHGKASTLSCRAKPQPFMLFLKVVWMYAERGKAYKHNIQRT